MIRTRDVITRISADVTRYCIEQMNMHPAASTVDIHAQSVTITLEGVMHPAEMDLARDPLLRVKLENLYSELFRVSKPVLHARIEHSLHCQVKRSFFAIESEYGNAVIVLFCDGDDTTV